MQVGKTGKIVFKILIFQSAVVTAKREMKNVVGSHGLEKQNQRNDGIQVEQIGDLPAELSAHKAGNIGEHKAPESAACQHKTDDIGKLLALKEVGQDGSGDQDEDAGTKADDEAAEQDQIDAGAARDDEQTTHEEAGDGQIRHLLFVHSAAQCKADKVSTSTQA